ncbi:MAG: hypothetical protein A2151_02755 [Candidatus Muproteobacteria bacterium RBG_16_65_34]|uniref:peptidylprolyl isomerase n=1 Tax=Candidatus Muproteobacteria bacterium RBG_16_65_34 TaxID=1817760 RepID=A0A1F6TM61_9PROT|nr:MAG: hypothetical protein A2151_02755 [Candidatus Muproteobacteria bacterium RBG_16_65_34]
MSILRPVVFALVSLPLLIASGCGPKSVDDTKAVATVNGERITENDLQKYLALRQSTQAALPDKDKELKVARDELIDRALLAKHAVDSGLDREPDVHFRLKQTRVNILAQAVINNYLKDRPVTDEDTKKRFQQEFEQTDKNEYRVRHILVKTEDEAKDLLAQLHKGAAFAALAKQKSTDLFSKDKGGDLGWINQGMGFVPEFFSAVAAMRKGDISKAPVKSDFGWHVMKLEDTRALKLPTYEQFVANPQAQDRLRRKIQEERINALLKELKDTAKIEIK